MRHESLANPVKWAIFCEMTPCLRKNLGFSAETGGFVGLRQGFRARAASLVHPAGLLPGERGEWSGRRPGCLWGSKPAETGSFSRNGHLFAQETHLLARNSQSRGSSARKSALKQSKRGGWQPPSAPAHNVRSRSLDHRTGVLLAGASAGSIGHL